MFVNSKYRVMDLITRSLEPLLMTYLRPNKVVVLLGARRVGKTELIKTVHAQLKEEVLFLNGEDEEVQASLQERSVRNFERLLGTTRILIIDEAQAIPDIGMKLKLMVDSIKGLRIIASGSSVFELNNQLGEPLVGRKNTFYLYPLAQMEFSQKEGYFTTRSKLNERLVFGTYPELEQLESTADKTRYLKEQISSYLLKDILAFEGIKKRETIVSLLRILAFRVGSEISIEGISNELQISKNTVDRYLDLLTKVFIIHQVSGFSRNLDNEITKKSKWYFYDNGIRNALINNFNPISLRDDQGKLWENYVISERLKYQEYTQQQASNFFWRTHTKQEIDWIEEKDGQLRAYELKWNAKKTVKVPALWGKNYQDATFEVIHPENYLDFIMD